VRKLPGDYEFLRRIAWLASVRAFTGTTSVPSLTKATASWGLRPRRLARFARPRTLRVLPTRRPAARAEPQGRGSGVAGS
jgi:hypothetical protein